MLTIAASVQRSYLFPARRAQALAWHRDVDRLLQFLPHVSVVHKEGDGAYRLLYSAVEAGLYRVRIHCDVRVAFDPDREIGRASCRERV